MDIMKRKINILPIIIFSLLGSQVYGLFRSVSKVTNGVLVPAERITEKVLPPAEPIVRTPGYITRGVADVIEGYGFRITNKAQKTIKVTFMRADGRTHKRRIHHNDWVTLSYMPREIKISCPSGRRLIGLLFDPELYRDQPVAIRANLAPNSVTVSPSRNITESEIQNAISSYQQQYMPK